MFYIFKTSVRNKKDAGKLRPRLNELLKSKWNFDLDDCDRILRIDGERDRLPAVIKLLQEFGFYCEELH